MKLTMPDGERWVNLRDKDKRFKSGERKKLYEVYDGLTGGDVSKQLALVQHILAHLIEDWSLEMPHPRIELANGSYGEISYLHMDSLDNVDTDMENELLSVAAGWLNQISINFTPTTDPASPTEVSGD